MSCAKIQTFKKPKGVLYFAPAPRSKITSKFQKNLRHPKPLMKLSQKHKLSKLSKLFNSNIVIFGS